MNTLLFAEEFNNGRFWEKPGSGAAHNQFFDRLPALFAVAEGPFVHIHAYKSIGEFQVHLSGELHGVIQRFFAVLQAIGNAVPDGFRDLAPKTWSQGFADGVASERKRQTRLFLPPDAEINHIVQTLFLEEKLSFVNEQTGFDKIVLNCINNFVERHDHGFKVGFEKPQRKRSEERRVGKESRYGSEQCQ